MRRLGVAFLLTTSMVRGASAAENAAEKRVRIQALAKQTWEVDAVHALGEIDVDGRFEEPEWAQAKPISDFYQRERHEGEPATEKTEVRVLFDDEALYVGFTCFDSDMTKSTARAMFRDESGGADDLVAVMLDAFHDHRTAIQFVTNSNGLMEDLFQNGENERTRNHDWDTVWYSRGTRNDKFWTAEVRIPFKSLRFERPPAGQPLIFGIGLKRNIPRKNEEVYWPFVPNDSSWYRPAELGHVVGLASESVRPGRNLEILPYALGATERTRIALTRDRERATGGLDVKWGVTPGLTADFSINTDFAQEEVDTQQINFTRFSLFFPEKRQFFLEGQRAFTIGVPGEAPLVFTRRIGLSSAGDVIPIAAGARVSGREGLWSIGAMDIETRKTATTPAENFAVLRARRDFGRRSGVGFLLTNREGGDVFNRVAAVDATFNVNRWTAEGFAAGVSEPSAVRHKRNPGRPTSDDAARNLGHHLRLAYDSDKFGATLRRLDLDENFQPGVGYVQRPGSEQHFGSFRWSPRRKGIVRQFHLEPRLNYITNQARELDTRDATFRASADFDTGDQLAIEYSGSREVLTQNFKLRSDVTIAPGSYDTGEWTLQVNTFRRRHLRGNFTARTGTFWNGERDVLSGDVTWRFSKHVGVQTRYEFNRVDLPAKAFKTHLVSGRVDVAFRTDVVLLSLVQYNSDNKQLSANIRFNWIPKPGTDFFIVYNDLDRTRLKSGARDRSLTAKLSYRFAL